MGPPAIEDVATAATVALVAGSAVRLAWTRGPSVRDSLTNLRDGRAVGRAVNRDLQPLKQIAPSAVIGCVPFRRWAALGPYRDAKEAFCSLERDYDEAYLPWLRRGIPDGVRGLLEAQRVHRLAGMGEELGHLQDQAQSRFERERAGGSLQRWIVELDRACNEGRDCLIARALGSVPRDALHTMNARHQLGKDATSFVKELSDVLNRDRGTPDFRVFDGELYRAGIVKFSGAQARDGVGQEQLEQWVGDTLDAGANDLAVLCAGPPGDLARHERRLRNWRMHRGHFVHALREPVPGSPNAYSFSTALIHFPLQSRPLFAGWSRRPFR